MNTHLTATLQNTRLWTNADPQLLTQLKDTNTQWFTCPSRTLTYALRETLGRSAYDTNLRMNAYNYLKGIYQLFLRNQTIRVTPIYLPISEEQCESYQTFTNSLQTRTPNNEYVNIYIYAMPRGKSFLKPILDTNTSLKRFKNVELCCTNSISHFIRIYKGFTGTNPQDITIFTSEVTTDLISMLWILLPQLLEITQQDCPENLDEQTTRNIQNYNASVKLLYDFCDTLYSLDAQANPESITNFTTQLTKLFNFKTRAISSFTECLANATNQNATRHYQNLLKDAISYIANLENDLRRAYNDKANYERQLLLTTLVTPEDVQPFFDTINASDHIEILSTTDSRLILRITAPLQYFSEDFERYENNPNSDFNYYYRNLPELKEILHEIFVTRNYKLLIQSIVELNINTSYGSSPLDIRAHTARDDFKNFTQFPNPHLYHHNCWAQARSEMHKNLTAGAYDLVVMQAVAATQTINVAEQTSFVSGLLADFRNQNFQNLVHIIDTNGNTLSLTELIEIHKNKKLEEIATELKTSNGYTQIELPNDDNDDEI